MKRRSVKGCGQFFTLITALSTLYPYLEAQADVECMASVSYGWEYTPPAPAPVEMKNKPEEEEEKPILPKKEELSVTYATRLVQGADEEAVKKKLQVILNKDLIDARAECARDHENLSGCISTKFLSVGPVLRQLDFSSRKALEESVQSDCKKQTGRCVQSEASEISCKEIKVVAAEGEEGEEGKEDKKKKKKSNYSLSESWFFVSCESRSSAT